jgi:hypothetical protein
MVNDAEFDDDGYNGYDDSNGVEGGGITDF